MKLNPLQKYLLHQTTNLGVRGSNPFGRAILFTSILVTWVTVYTGDIGNSFRPKGLAIGSILHVSSSK